MDIFEFFTNHLGTITFIFYSFMLSIGCFFLGYYMGSFNCIRDDLKSLDYDNLLIENNELKKTIEKMMEVKGRKR